MVLGSEGRLGIITEATVHVRRIPERARDPRLPVPDVRPTGSRRCRRSAGSEYSASVTRVSDANETQFSFAMRVNPDDRRQAAVGALQSCSCAGGAGSIPSRCASRSSAMRAASGTSRRSDARSGDSSSATAGCASDPARASCTTRRSSTSPTSATSCSTGERPATCPRRRRRGAISMPLYNAVTAAANGAFAELGVQGYVMCHLSHSYHAGACLYFTFAFGATSRTPMAGRVRGRQVRDPAGVRRQRRHALASPRGRHRARAVARAGHLGARAWRCSRRCSTGPTRGST